MGKGKEQVSEKRKAHMEKKHLPKKMKMKAHKRPSDIYLGSDDYEFIANRVQETLDAPMTVIVTTQTVMKSTLDLQIAELKTIMERASQLTT